VKHSAEEKWEILPEGSKSGNIHETRRKHGVAPDQWHCWRAEAEAIEPPGVKYLFQVGGWSDDVLEVLKKLDYWMVSWNANSHDRDDSRRPSEWKETAISQMRYRNQNVVLFHDNEVPTASRLDNFNNGILDLYAASPRILNSANPANQNAMSGPIPGMRGWMMIEDVYLVNPD